MIYPQFYPHGLMQSWGFNPKKFLWEYGSYVQGLTRKNHFLNGLVLMINQYSQIIRVYEGPIDLQQLIVADSQSIVGWPLAGVWFESPRNQINGERWRFFLQHVGHMWFLSQSSISGDVEPKFFSGIWIRLITFTVSASTRRVNANLCPMSLYVPILFLQDTFGSVHSLVVVAGHHGGCLGQCWIAGERCAGASRRKIWWRTFAVVHSVTGSSFGNAFHMFEPPDGFKCQGFFLVAMIPALFLQDERNCRQRVI